MSGICGWIGGRPGHDENSHVIRHMAEGLRSFGAGEAGSHAAGDCALHIIMSDGEGDFYADDQFLIAISGRPRWTAPDLAATARECGHARALRDAYRSKKLDLFDSLYGNFALAVVDRRNKAVLLAVDRVGIEAMCYGTGDSGSFIFGSTTNAVRRHPDIGATIPMQAIYDYLVSWTLHSPWTIYKEQSKLLPGQFLRWQDGEIETGFYWRMPYQESPEAESGELSRELLDVLRGGVSRSVGDSDPATLGAFLSGGLDSSTLTGLVAELHGKLNTFTIGFDIERFDERAYARLAARHFGTSHKEYVVTPSDVVDLLPRLADWYDEPFGNSSVVPTYYCAKLAKENGIDVMIAGDGGDEIFAGNYRYLHMMKIAAYGRIPKSFRERVLEPLLFAVPGGDALPLIGKARRLVELYKTSMPDRLYAHEPVANTPLHQLFEPDIAAQIDNGRFAKLARDTYMRPATGTMLQRMMHLDLHTVLADDDLRKVGRMCQAAGVQVRFPLLDDEVVAFSARVPSRLMIRGGRLRSFFKNAVTGFLPDDIITKRKHGFGLPFQQWLKEHTVLKELVEDSLAAFGNRNYVRPQFLDRVRQSLNTSEVTSFEGAAYDITVLELWLQRHAGGKR